MQLTRKPREEKGLFRKRKFVKRKLGWRLRCKLKLELEKQRNKLRKRQLKKQQIRKLQKKRLPKRAAEISKRVPDSSVTLNAQVEGLTVKLIRAAESALSLEQQRLKKLKELEERNQSLKLSSNKFDSFERHISRVIKQISGTKDNVSAKANDIVRILNGPECPQSISITVFAEKVKWMFWA